MLLTFTSSWQGLQDSDLRPEWHLCCSVLSHAARRHWSPIRHALRRWPRLTPVFSRDSSTPTPRLNAHLLTRLPERGSRVAGHAWCAVRLNSRCAFSRECSRRAAVCRANRSETGHRLQRACLMGGDRVCNTVLRDKRYNTDTIRDPENRILKPARGGEGQQQFREELHLEGGGEASSDGGADSRPRKRASELLEDWRRPVAGLAGGERSCGR